METHYRYRQTEWKAVIYGDSQRSVQTPRSYQDQWMPDTAGKIMTQDVTGESSKTQVLKKEANCN